MIEIKKTVYAPRGQAKTNHYSTCLLCRLVPHSNLFLFVIAQLSLTLLCLRKTDREREKRGETRLHRKANQLFRKENARTKIRKKKKKARIRMRKTDFYETEKRHASRREYLVCPSIAGLLNSPDVSQQTASTSSRQRRNAKKRRKENMTGQEHARARGKVTVTRTLHRTNFLSRSTDLTRRKGEKKRKAPIIPREYRDSA